MQLTICIVIFVLSLVSYALNKIPMTVTALISMAALIFTGCLDANTALGGFANNNQVLIVGMFVVAAGLNRTSFVDKLSDAIVKVSGGSYKRAYLGYILLAFVITSVLNNATASLAIVFPLYSAMCKKFDISPSKGVFALCIVCIGCSGVLPFGTAVMLTGQFTGFFETFGFTDIVINPIHFTMGRWPIAVLILVWAYFFAPKFAPDQPIVPIITSQAGGQEKKPLKPLGEFMGVATFVLTVFFIIFGGNFGIAPWQACLVGPLVLVVCGTLTEKEFFNAMPMNIVMMYTGALAMGNALSGTGAADVVGQWLATLVGGTTNSYVLGALFFIVPFLLTQFMLNSAVTNIFVPIALLTCNALGANPLGLAIIIPSACMTSFLTPMATPTIPLCMGAGGYDVRSIFKQGLPLALIIAPIYIFYVMTVFPCF